MTTPSLPSFSPHQMPTDRNATSLPWPGRLRVVLSLWTVLLAALWMSAAALGQSPPPAGAGTASKPEAETRIKTEEHWYTVELAGQRSGHMHSSRTITPTTVTSDSTMSLAIKRGPVEIKISMDSTFIESVDGKPISMISVQTLGASPVEQRYTFNADGIVAVTRQGGEETTRKLPLPAGEWLSPYAAEQEFERRFRAGEKVVTLRTIDPTSAATPIEVTRREIGPTKINVKGAEVEGTRYSVTTSLTPGIEMKEVSDAAGTVLLTESNIGGIALTMVLSTREIAEGKTNPPELLVSTFVRPDRPIREPRTLKWAIYELFVDEGNITDLPSAGAQRAQRQDGRVYRVVVDAGSQLITPDAEAKDSTYLAATTAANFKDDVIAALVKKTLADAPADRPARAEKLRRLVHTYIRKKSLGVGFGTASETVRSREGDCTEHAVLLATLLRADGTPSRVVSGLVYADQFAGENNIFGYHMWTQALLTVDGYTKWVDLDAALSDEIPFDATHLALAYSDLSDATGVASMAQMVGLLGKLKVIVVETDTDLHPGK